MLTVPAAAARGLGPPPASGGEGGSSWGDARRFVQYAGRALAAAGLPDRRSPSELASWAAAACADEQGRFWEFHDRLFANQRALKQENLAAYAQQVGLDIGRYESCLAGDAMAAKVQEDIDAAEALGISGTPAFFVNGIQLSGAKPLSDFVEVIDRELALAASKEESS